MRKVACWLAAGLLLAPLMPAQAGVVTGGTRVVYSDKSGAELSLRNTSQVPWLVNVRALHGRNWPGNTTAYSGTVPFIATPPLFVLKAGRENKIRLIRTGGNLPADRESLFTLSIRTIPSGEAGPQTVQMAVRSRLKLFYRPDGLKGDPQMAYRKLHWRQTPQGLTVNNPTPYYVTLFNLSAGGKPVSNAGVVAPFSTRQTDWCRKASACSLHWQTLNDYGRVMPVMTATAGPAKQEMK